MRIHSLHNIHNWSTRRTGDKPCVATQSFLICIPCCSESAVCLRGRAASEMRKPGSRLEDGERHKNRASGPWPTRLIVLLSINGFQVFLSWKLEVAALNTTIYEILHAEVSVCIFS